MAWFKCQSLWIRFEEILLDAGLQCYPWNVKWWLHQKTRGWFLCRCQQEPSHSLSVGFERLVRFTSYAFMLAHDQENYQQFCFVYVSHTLSRCDPRETNPRNTCLEILNAANVRRLQWLWVGTCKLATCRAILWWWKPGYGNIIGPLDWQGKTISGKSMEQFLPETILWVFWLPWCDFCPKSGPAQAVTRWFTARSRKSSVLPLMSNELMGG